MRAHATLRIKLDAIAFGVRSPIHHCEVTHRGHVAMYIYEPPSMLRFPLCCLSTPSFPVTLKKKKKAFKETLKLIQISRWHSVDKVAPTCISWAQLVSLKRHAAHSVDVESLYIMNINCKSLMAKHGWPVPPGGEKKSQSLISRPQKEFAPRLVCTSCAAAYASWKSTSAC